MTASMSILSKSHDHSNSLLRFQDCNDAICPKCMVQCAVGSRCKKCAGKFSSHVVKVTPAIMVKAGICSLLVGFVFGNCLDQVPSYSFFIWAVLIAAGVAVGKVLHRISSYKMGPTIAAAVAAGLIAGLMVSPARETTAAFIMGGFHAASDPDAQNALTSLALTRMASIVVFLGAIMSLFMNYK
ncbi:MAG TPA: hypothetical protein V6C76_07345 [Drouetiella sp.]